MAVIVGDTDVLIDFLTDTAPMADRVEREVCAGTLCTTSITVFELLAGATNDAGKRRLEHMLAPLDVLAFDEEAARASALARRELDRMGTPIGMADYEIAGICLTRSLPLLTRNRGQFERVPDLLLA